MHVGMPTFRPLLFDKQYDLPKTVKVVVAFKTCTSWKESVPLLQCNSVTTPYRISGPSV